MFNFVLGSKQTDAICPVDADLHPGCVRLIPFTLGASDYEFLENLDPSGHDFDFNYIRTV